MEHKDKSILDGMQTKEDGFPLGKGFMKDRPPKVMEIVGHCPKCGCCIYGHKTAVAGEQPEVMRSCSCPC